MTRHFYDDKLNKRPDQLPSLESTNAEMHVITIVVEGGCVVDVKNLPDDWYYEIDDRDIDDDNTAYGAGYFRQREGNYED